MPFEAVRMAWGDADRLIYLDEKTLQKAHYGNRTLHFLDDRVEYIQKEPEDG
jgi:hypothetical protein